MGYRREPFEIGEWYHCFNRGIDRRSVFESEDDCWRFLQLLYLANDGARINRENFSHVLREAIFNRVREHPIVRIGAYCLMGNHFHLLLQEAAESGITTFMHKVGTGYTMYFNERYRRIGNLFVKPFRSKHVGSDDYFYRVAQYIHLNPAERFEPRWKIGKVKNLSALANQLLKYPFSSLPDFNDKNRFQRTILDVDAIKTIAIQMPPLMSALYDAQEYYRRLDADYWNIRDDDNP